MSAHMACPRCGATPTMVTETRQAPHNELKRTRKCPAGHSFKTYETIDDDGKEG